MNKGKEEPKTEDDWIVFSLDGDTQTVDPQTVDVTLIKIVLPSF